MAPGAARSWVLGPGLSRRRGVRLRGRPGRRLGSAQAPAEPPGCALPAGCRPRGASKAPGSRGVQTAQRQPQETRLRVSEVSQPKGKSWRGPRRHRGQPPAGVPGPAAPAAPRWPRPLAERPGRAAPALRSLLRRAFLAASCLCLWFPLGTSREREAVNLRPAREPSARRPARGARCARPAPGELSLSRVCFLSCWHALRSSTTGSSGKQLPPRSKGPF